MVQRTADYPVVGRYLGLVAIALVAIIGLMLMPVPAERKKIACDTLTLTGRITPETFLSARDCLVHSSAANKTFVVQESGGGSWVAALALGILIHRHGWNVEVVDLCASSCANFIFPAGRMKYLNRESMLVFHGGPHQQNLAEQAVEIDQAATGQRQPEEPREPGRAGMEGHAYVDDETAAQRLEVLEFLEIRNVTDAADLISKLRIVSDQFYEELGVNPLLPTYGQIGSYEPVYKSYKYGGFIYRLDSLRRLGLKNIEVKGGEWRPERHRVYHEVYEVEYP